MGEGSEKASRLWRIRQPWSNGDSCWLSTSVSGICCGIMGKAGEGFGQGMQMETIGQMELDAEKLNCSVFKSCCSLRGAEANNMTGLTFHFQSSWRVWECEPLLKPVTSDVKQYKGIKPRCWNSLHLSKCAAAGLLLIFIEKLTRSPFFPMDSTLRKMFLKSPLLTHFWTGSRDNFYLWCLIFPLAAKIWF